MTAVPVVLNVLKVIGFDVGPLPESVSGTLALNYWVIGIGSFVLIAIRFPRVAFVITAVIWGRPKLLPPQGMTFRGPRPYSSEDQLPGRYADIDSCWMSIRHKPFFILQGESGCGKSSILNAALIPKCRERFRVVECRVADNPFDKLQYALKETYYKPDSGRDEMALAEAISSAFDASYIDTPNPPARHIPLLVCLDQFEEFFVAVRDQARTRFLAVLKEAIAQGKLRLVVAIRSDFRDLLDKVCREVDPEHKVLDLGSYYDLKAFRKEQAETVLNEMLAPLHNKEPILKQQLTDFTTALVDELLRAPRDPRVYQNDEKTVLPVELQIVGGMIESLGINHFSVTGLRRLGGKAGLLRAYLRDAKDYVFRKTAVPGEPALLILRQLISPARTKRVQTAQFISKSLGFPDEKITKVLDAFSDKYLVNRLPAGAAEGGAGPSISLNRYELMHEHLVNVLVEAPEQVLQAAKDAEERLSFWKERTKTVFGPDATGKHRSLPTLLRSSMAMPIPLTENLRLWRFAFRNEEKRMLLRNLRGFGLRLAIVILPLLGYGAWTYTDPYQINTIIALANVVPGETGSLFGSRRGYDYKSGQYKSGQGIEWCRALVRVGAFDEAVTATHKLIVNARFRYSAQGVSAVVGETVADLGGDVDDLLEIFMRAIEREDFWPEALVGFAKGMIRAGKIHEATRVLNMALSKLRTASGDVGIPLSLAVIGEGLVKAGKSADGLRILHEAFEAALGIPPDAYRIGLAGLRLSQRLLTLLSPWVGLQRRPRRWIRLFPQYRRSPTRKYGPARGGMSPRYS